MHVHVHVYVYCEECEERRSAARNSSNAQRPRPAPVLLLCHYPFFFPSAPSVPLPVPIAIHHVLLIAAWQVIFCWDGYEFYMSAGALLEINTFFLIAKRHIPKTTNTWLLLLHHTCTFCDHATWATLRLVVLPLSVYNGYAIWSYLSTDCAAQALYLQSISALNAINSSAISGITSAGAVAGVGKYGEQGSNA